MLYFNAPSDLTLEKVSPFAYAYFFESLTFYLLAIKTNSFTNGSASAEQQWLLIQKGNLKVASLNLRFKDSSTVVEERFFDEGYLKFNANTATFIEKYNSALHNLTPVHSMAIPTAIHETVADFIKN